MSPTFDPYYKWLAIPPAEQPPNHYRLLALNLFESDADVIATAADQRMAHIRSFQGGQYVDASQRLLNELASARLCLLRADKKAAYDANLRATLAAQAAQTAPPPIPSIADAPVQEAPIQEPPPLVFSPNAGEAAAPSLRPLSSQPPLPARPSYPSQPVAESFVAETDQPDTVQAIAAKLEPQSVVSRSLGPRPAADFHDENDPLGLADSIDRYPKRSTLPRPRKQSFPRVFLIAPLVGVAAVVAAVTYNNIRDAMDQSGSESGGTIANSSKHPIETSLHTNGSHEKSGPQSTKPRADFGFTPRFSPGDDATSPSPADGSDPKAAGSPTSENSSPGSRLADDKPTAVKLPVPDAEAQRKALLEIKKVYKDEFAKATSVEGRAALAKKLGELAANPNEDPTIRYVFATQALENAIKLCDPKLASAMVSGLSACYEVDPWDLKAKTLAQLGVAAKTPEARQLIAGGAFELVDKALAEERYDAAELLASTASDIAATLRDTVFREKAIEAHTRARRMQQEAAEVQSAQERLARRSDDAAAHLLIGRFFCMERDDWDSGLPHLVGGSDADLSAMAHRDLAGAANPADQMALADAWWEMADQRRDALDAPTVKGMRNRAVYWYRRAMPQLSGFAQAKAQKRIAEIVSGIAAKP
jgi:hypothetical protein